MEVSWLKWNLFRVGSGTRITYLQNQHDPLFTVEDLPSVPPQQSHSLFFLVFFFFCTLHFQKTLPTFLSAFDFFLFDSSQNKQLNMRWMVPCFCCDFEVWKKIKARLTESKQENLYTTESCFHRTAGQLDIFFPLTSQFFIFINIPILREFDILRNTSTKNNCFLW